MDGILRSFLNKALELSRFKKQTLVLAGDIVFSLLSSWLAFSLRYEQFHFPVGLQWLVYGICCVLFVPFFIRFGLYRAIFRYSGVDSIIGIAKAIGIYGAILFTILVVFRFPGVPRSVGILQPILFFMFVANGRLIASHLLQTLLNRGVSEKRVLVYGAGKAGAQVAATLAIERAYKIVGFIDDDPKKHSGRLNNVPIFRPGEIQGLIDRFAVSEILLAIPGAGVERRREIIANLEECRVRIRTIPGLDELAREDVTVADVQDLKMIDLLDREPIVTPSGDLGIAGKAVLVTGAGGSIGSELCRQILSMNPVELILMDHNEYGLYMIEHELQVVAKNRAVETQIHTYLASVRDENRLEKIFSEHKPDTVFHAAAYKHVPLVETNPIEAVSNNIFGTLRVIEQSRRAGVERFTLISTDKAVRPTSIMGATKRFAEKIVQAVASQENGGLTCSMVRFGNVLGSSGSVIPLFRAQIENGGPITITHPDVTRYFMTIPEAVGLVLQAGHMARGGEVFVLDMGEPVKIMKLAKKMIRLSGHLEKTKDNPDGNIEIKTIGLRPGEKLYEELLIGRNPQKTKNPHIMMAQEEFTPWPELKKEIKAFEKVIAENDVDLAMTILARNVSGFHGRQHPKNGSA